MYILMFNITCSYYQVHDEYGRAAELMNALGRTEEDADISARIDNLLRAAASAERAMAMTGAGAAAAGGAEQLLDLRDTLDIARKCELLLLD